MPRKRSEPVSPRSQREDRPQAANAEGDGPAWLPPVVAMLVTVRFFVPAESAAEGETLWIVLLWLLCGLAWLFDAYRNGDSLRRFDGLDAAVGLLVGGHVISALCILATEGQKRAALNLLWEWLGVGVALLLLRAAMRQRKPRNQMLSVIVISGVVLAGLGVWQHFVWYPRISAQFAEMDELQRAPADEDPEGTRDRLQRLGELRGELGLQGARGDSSSRSFQDRVQASTEPIGRFALANTFAGLLLVALFLLAGGVWRSAQQSRPAAAPAFWRAAGWLIGLLLVGYCLWLTKSRTALVGLLCGIGVAGVLSRRVLFARRWTRWVLVGGMLVFVSLPIAAALSGSLDRQVISEAPKSLRYRWEYWQATSRLIGEHPWLGVGPGNFRQHYLRYKLPGSSEEILDPHNLILDVWANGGAIALAGLLGLLGVSVRRFWSRLREPDGNNMVSDPRHSVRQTMLFGGVGTVALMLAALMQLLQGTGLADDWLVLGAAWWVTAGLLTLGLPCAWPVTVLMAAFVGLVVHLTGAGGIAMPAILQVLLILVLAADPLSSSSEAALGLAAETSRVGRVVIPSLLMAGLALVVGCVMTAIVPVTTATAAMNLGRTLWLTDGQPLAADRTLLQATEADWLSPQPWQELSRLRTERWLQTSGERDFQKAVDAQQEAIRRDPSSASRRRALGGLWSLRFERQPNLEFAESAYSAYSQAVQRYPHLAVAQADLAVAARNANKPARAAEAAKMALSLDKANRRHGHVDKYLAVSQLAELQQIIEGSGNNLGNGPDE